MNIKEYTNKNILIAHQKALSFDKVKEKYFQLWLNACLTLNLNLSLHLIQLRRPGLHCSYFCSLYIDISQCIRDQQSRRCFICSRGMSILGAGLGQTPVCTLWGQFHHFHKLTNLVRLVKPPLGSLCGFHTKVCIGIWLLRPYFKRTKARSH